MKHREKNGRKIVVSFFLIFILLLCAIIYGKFLRPVKSPGKPVSTVLSTPKATIPLEFTMFRGNPQRNLSAIGTVPRRPKLLWRMQTRTKLEGQYEQRGSKTLTAASPWSGLGWTGQPIRRENKIYFGSSDSYVYCLDALTGEVQWYYPNHHCVKGSISLFGDYLYHGGRDNKLHCYDLQGKMVWETRIGNDMDSNPVVVDGRCYVGGEDKYIYCFDAKSGEMIWRVGKTEGSVESSPCIANGLLYAGSGRGLLYCIRDGKVQWKFATLGDTDSTPVYYNNTIYVACATGDVGEKGHLWAVDATTGKPIWHNKYSRGIWATVALNPKLGRLYVGCNDGNFYALNMADGALIWQKKLGNRIWSSAAVSDGCIVVATRDGRLWCLEEKSGEPLWVFDDGFDIDATPLVAGGMIVIGSQNGWVYGIGESAVDEQVNPHWFATQFPLYRRTDHDSEGIHTVINPAPSPLTYQDTDDHTVTNLLHPVYSSTN